VQLSTNLIRCAFIRFKHMRLYAGVMGHNERAYFNFIFLVSQLLGSSHSLVLSKILHSSYYMHSIQMSFYQSECIFSTDKFSYFLSNIVVIGPLSICISDTISILWFEPIKDGAMPVLSPVMIGHGRVKSCEIWNWIRLATCIYFIITVFVTFPWYYSTTDRYFRHFPPLSFFPFAWYLRFTFLYFLFLFIFICFLFSLFLSKYKTKSWFL